MPSRWEQLLAAKPVPLLEHFRDEVAKLLATDLERWPPPVQEVDPATIGAFATVLAPDAPAPHPAVYAEAFRLARWQLGRELDAYDDYLRNRRFLAAGVPPSDRPALLFLERWLTEQMHELGEATGGRFNRPLMLECLERTEALLRARR
ncbi:MAG: hypothetical protein L0Y66_15545 [Myxococcaceae bacterium]|nr:hypothetical protein [Myxococcaceae bacterium]MCI0671969.1 hypothetical protein [Myxococcaceae bacterium]